MMSDREVEYKTTVQDEHWRQEEFQWARVLSTGHAAKGMVLLYLQKACTAFHEFEPAFAAGALDDRRVSFFCDRLAGRLRQLLTTMENNELGRINGATQLREILRTAESAQSLEALAELTEQLHQTGHVLLDALEES
jgi:hypothetical protein